MYKDSIWFFMFNFVSKVKRCFFLFFVIEILKVFLLIMWFLFLMLELLFDGGSWFLCVFNGKNFFVLLVFVDEIVFEDEMYFLGFK